MAGPAATRRMPTSTISEGPSVVPQERINFEIFKAVETLGRKLERAEETRNLLIERLSDLESSATRDAKTGRLYLPMVIDPASMPRPVMQAPRWMVAASVTSTAVACLALAMVLLRDPVLPTPSLSSSPIMASGDSYKGVILSGGPDSAGWRAIDLKTASSSDMAMSQSKAARIKTLARQELQAFDAADTAQDAVKEAVEAKAVAVATVVKPVSEPVPALPPAAPSSSGLTVAELAAAPPVPATTAVKAAPVEVEKPIPVVEAKKAPVVPEVKTVANKTTEKKTVTARTTTVDAAPAPASKVAAAPKAPVSVEAALPRKPEAVASAAIQPDPALPEGVRDLEARALGGSAEAQHDLATLYASGKLVTLNYDRARYWFTRAADGGIANAHYNIGVMYHQGLGVEPDMKTAIVAYERAAELGHPEAMYNLGIAFVEGVGVAADTGRGVSYFKRAADAGVPQAAYNLGVLYESNFIGAIDTVKAREWYKKAGDLGHPEAGEALARLDENSVPTGVGGAATDYAEAGDGIEPAAGEEGGIGEGDMTMPGDEVRDEPAPVRPAAIKGAEKVDTRLVAKIQNILISQGHLPPDRADGVLDDKTADAIRVWQKSAKLPVDGQPTQNLLDFMLYSNNPDGVKK